jgi:hypothetical protein
LRLQARHSKGEVGGSAAVAPPTNFDVRPRWPLSELD